MWVRLNLSRNFVGRKLHQILPGVTYRNSNSALSVCLFVCNFLPEALKKLDSTLRNDCSNDSVWTFSALRF